MCVIMLVDRKRPTEEMVSKAHLQNDDGGGLAWRHEGRVHWKKGLDEAEMQRMCHILPMPYVAHFRVASVGGVRNSLCHPFLVANDASDALEGQTDGRVLFHNGDWKDWRQTMLAAVLKSGVPIPEGKWSDTRAMAFLCSLYGINFMETIDEKGIAFGPHDLEIFGTGRNGWTDIREVWCSNDYFMIRNQGRFTGASMCKDRHCTIKDNLDDQGFCYKHRVPKALAAHTEAPKTDAVTTVLTSKAEAGGAQPTETPFQMVARAEKAFKDGSLSKTQLKKIRKRYQNTTHQLTTTPPTAVPPEQLIVLD